MTNAFLPDVYTHLTESHWQDFKEFMIQHRHKRARVEGKKYAEVAQSESPWQHRQGWKKIAQ